jgi:glycerophosphoryl diester phosphodiesterase
MKRIALLLFVTAFMLISCGKEDTTASADTDVSSENATYAEEITEAPAEHYASPPAYDGFHEKLIAHAGGAAYGYRLTNSLEALENSYELGFRIFELDFERTSDEKYVLLHDWDSMAGRMLFEKRVFSLDEFKNADTFASLTLLDLDDLLEWLSVHEDCFIITDAKCGNEPFLSELYGIAEALSDRFIPQAYSYEEYRKAKEIGFKNVLLTLYQMNDTEEALVSFAESEKPWAVTIPETVLTRSLVSSLAKAGIYTYAHTVNDLSFYEEWQAFGLYGIYTDYFCPIKWPYQ